MEEIIMQIPMVTRILTLSSIGLTFICYLELLTPINMYFNWELIQAKHQFYRILSAPLFLGELSINTCFKFVLLYRFSCRLEDYTFRGNSISYLFFVLFGLTLITISAIFTGQLLLSDSFLTMLLYLWSRKNKQAMVHIFGLLPLPAPYLTWFFVLIQIIVGDEILPDLLGIIVGHIYYFITDIYPKLPLSKDKKLLDPPPQIFINIFKFLGFQQNNLDQQFDDEQGDDLPFGI